MIAPTQQLNSIFGSLLKPPRAKKRTPKIFTIEPVRTEQAIGVEHLAEQINAEHEAAFGKAREALEHARRAGELLLEVKAKLQHGEFLPWLQTHCKVSERSAQRYMKLAEGWERLRSKSDTVSDLTLRDALKCLSSSASKVESGEASEEAEQVQGDDAPDPEPVRAKRMSRSGRWADAVQRAQEALEELIEIQGELEGWRDSLPENLSGSAVAEKLDAVVEIDLQAALEAIGEAADADLPLGFGRD